MPDTACATRLRQSQSQEGKLVICALAVVGSTLPLILIGSHHAVDASSLLPYSAMAGAMILFAVAEWNRLLSNESSEILPRRDFILRVAASESAPGDSRSPQIALQEIEMPEGDMSGVAIALQRQDGSHWVTGDNAELLIGLPRGFSSSGIMPQRVVRAEDLSAVSAAHAVFKASGVPCTTEFRVVDEPKRRELWVRETLLRLPDSQTLTILRDITREKNLEVEAEIALLSAEGAKRGRATFLSNIDHEFRTPLNTIIGFSEIIQGQVLGPIGNTRYAEYVGDIHASGQLLLSLVDSLLDLAKAETGTLALDEEDTDLVQLIMESGQLMRQSAERASVNLTLDCPPDLPHAYIDSLKIKRALLVLLDNAIKFTQAEGSVVVGALVAENGDIAITVVDEGVGVDPAEIKDIFDSRSRRHDQKVGVGLPLAHRLVERHGGSITMTSAGVRGTVVRLVLPGFRAIQPNLSSWSTRGGAVSTTSAPTRITSAQRRILCVDADPLVSRTVRQFLREIGDRSEVLWRDSAQSCLEAIASLKPDIVLLDWRLRDSDGNDLADTIRATPDIGGLPLILLSDVDLDCGSNTLPGGAPGSWLRKGDLSAANLKAALAIAMSDTKPRRA